MDRTRSFLIFISLISLTLLAASCEAEETLEPPTQEELKTIEAEVAMTPEGYCVSADHLILRIHRNGHVIDEGANMTMEHRGEVPITICPDGEFAWVGEGLGQSVNDYSPYSLDICRYKIDFLAEGDLHPPECVLEITIREEIKSGECMHFDPNTTLAYPYAAWDAMYEIAFFELPNIAGKASYEWEKDELVGVVHWIEDVQVWTVGHLPFCEPEGYQLLQVPTMEPWPTPTWQP